jgi:hypothetical protein
MENRHGDRARGFAVLTDEPLSHCVTITANANSTSVLSGPEHVIGLVGASFRTRPVTLVCFSPLLRKGPSLCERYPMF